MSWRPAQSLEVLWRQINTLAPNRSKAADGAIGDTAHSNRVSDHNPNSAGVVTARDFTHDPKNGIDARKLAEALVASRDPRIKYIISNREIVAGDAGPSPWQWRRYTGSNPHTKHVHISVRSAKSFYDDDALWRLPGFAAFPAAEAEPVRTRPTLRRGSEGADVRYLQSKIGTSVDGDFGPKTEAAVKGFQTKNNLVPDGIVGPYTWEALG